MHCNESVLISCMFVSMFLAWSVYHWLSMKLKPGNACWKEWWKEEAINRSEIEARLLQCIVSKISNIDDVEEPCSSNALTKDSEWSDIE